MWSACLLLSLSWLASASAASLEWRPSSSGHAVIVAVSPGDEVVEAAAAERAGCTRSSLSSDFSCPDLVSAEAFAADLRKANVEATVEIKQDDETRAATQLSFQEYPRYSAIISYLESVSSSYPSFARLTFPGSSRENRSLPMLFMGTSPNGTNTRAIWVDAGIHAREWIAPITALYLVDRLVEAFSTDSDSDVTAVDWYIMPMLNPDGYEYSHTTDRLWRKNRAAPPKGSSCYGVDLNRNWDVVGFGVGASTDPCSNSYRGTEPASEPEVATAQQQIMMRKDYIRASISLHSFGQLWLTSWGYKASLPADNDKMVALGTRAAKAIRAVNGRKYTVGAAGAIFYPAGGASDDFAKARAQIPFAITIELPGDKSPRSAGFQLPESEILSVGREIWTAMAVVASEAKAQPLGPDLDDEEDVRRDLQKKWD